MQKLTQEWILAGDGSIPELPYGFVCQRCGVKQYVGAGVQVVTYIAMGKLFVKQHKDCEESDRKQPLCTTKK